MKVSASVRPEHVIAAAYVAAHLPSLSPTLEDIDSLNFALGLRDFDPARHQPHPPGYPVYIALARVSHAVVSRAAPSLDRPAAEALALTIWSVAAGAIAIVAAAALFRAVQRRNDATAHGPWFTHPVTWAVTLLAASPLFWMSGLRPMSDMPGLAMTLVALALMVRGIHEPRWLAAGALAAGLAAGVRSQTVFLTLPVLALGLASQRHLGVAWLISRPIAALAAGGLAWAVPLIAASGGVSGYLAALNTQAELDFAGVDMVWLNPTPRRLAFSLYETFAMPWASIPLAAVVVAAALAGAFAMLTRERRALAVLLAAFGPYAAFHLLWQETLTVRYALPLLPFVCWLAARGIAALGRATPLAGLPLAGAALLVAVPAGVDYGREAHPAFRAIDDARRRADVEPPAATYAHYALGRPLEVVDASALHVKPPRQHVEWLGLVDYWRAGGEAPVWLFADPRRTDIALVDPYARLDVVRYRWRVANRPELSGSRPLAVDWYRLTPPAWFAGEGWSLTPETGGQARATAKGPDQQPIEAWVRRGTAPIHLMVEARHTGDVADPAAAIELAVDGRVRDRWTAAPRDGNALRFLDLPDGLPGDGAYARVTIESRAVGPVIRRAPVAVRQFDAQEASQLIYGYAEGWHDLEYDARTGLLWRWSSDRSVIRVHGIPQDVRVTLRGESPLRYFDTPPAVSVIAGGRTVGVFHPADDFELTAVVPADLVASGGGAITLALDRAYLPGVAEGTSDARRLGLRLFEIRVHPVAP